MGTMIERASGDRRFRLAVSVAALLSLTIQPLPAGAFAKNDPVLDTCATERAPLVKLDTEYKEMRRSKLGAAIGEGIKQGGLFLAKGVMNGSIPLPGSHSGGGFGGGIGALGMMNPLGAVAGLAAQQAAQQQAQQQAQAYGAPQPQAGPAMPFGQDMLTGALGLNVPGVSDARVLGVAGDSGKAYAALAVLVAIVATAEAYAQLKEQEAGGDLHKASLNIDQDAARQLAVTHDIADSSSALVECRSRQLNDINTRLASASNDKDRKAIKRERTELQGALKKDIDLTGGVVDQHVGMAKTFTQGRAMTDGSSEAEVLGGQAPAYATAANTTKLSMPKANAPAGGGGGAAPQQQAAAPPPALVALKATTVRAAPVASAAVLMNFPAGREVKPRTAQADGGWWEIDVGGQPGYVRAADLGPPGSAPVEVASAAAGPAKGGAKGAKGHGGGPSPKAAPPPVPQGPSNIRAYNQSVIAVRDNGKGRLSSLMTDIQTSQWRDNILYAWLSHFGLG